MNDNEIVWSITNVSTGKIVASMTLGDFKKLDKTGTGYDTVTGKLDILHPDGSKEYQTLYNGKIHITEPELVLLIDEVIRTEDKRPLYKAVKRFSKQSINKALLILD